MSGKKPRKSAGKDSNLKECTYYIDGMHCASCEVLIEKKLIKEKSVENVDASLGDGKVVFQYNGEKPSPDYLTSIFKESGYTFSERKYKKEKETPIFQVHDGLLEINRQKLAGAINVLIAVLIILFGFKAIEDTGIAGNIVLSNSSTYFSFFIFGIFAGLSSCAALIGGLLLSLSKQWSELYIESDSKVQRLKPFTMFNVGRLLSFVILGGLLGALGSALGISLNRAPALTAVVVMIVSAIMLVLGLQMLGIKWAYKFKIALPKFLTRGISSEEKFKGKSMPFLVGALTFFLPCGFTLIAQGLALTSGSFLRGSLMMLAFALGTLPMLGLISLTSVNVTKKPRLNALFSSISGVLVVLFSLYNFNSQLNVLGFKSASDIKIVQGSDAKKEIATVPVDENGVQIMKLTAKGFAYTPQTETTLKAGVPAKMVVDNQGMQGCGVYMAARGLIKSYVFLEPGENEVDLGAPTKGTYKLTCSMGMVPPVTIKVI
ncbi:MAG: hypothetical protein UT34_C0002G0281 [candidate division WS6 bacterium GW2011_GWF2_39_15]|uniref:HMA domain-containing protein n=1 Tax=candidate division WS6 bacterium GW2011_GWF2_39_15 TaxID=1619100 RepID=A0A0G0MNY0_9BACT|nr:MAG: hypothetical protein UT34_C0002G0281 [candidate division WS6 bacterium GW2011_GWF2_39_15]